MSVIMHKCYYIHQQLTDNGTLKHEIQRMLGLHNYIGKKKICFLSHYNTCIWLAKKNLNQTEKLSIHTACINVYFMQRHAQRITTIYMYTIHIYQNYVSGGILYFLSICHKLCFVRTRSSKLLVRCSPNITGMISTKPSYAYHINLHST